MASIADGAVLVTGGNRGIGRAVVEEALNREDIVPDPMAQSMAESWHSGAAKALERQYAAIAQASTSPVGVGELTEGLLVARLGARERAYNHSRIRFPLRLSLVMTPAALEKDRLSVPAAGGASTSEDLTNDHRRQA